MWFFFQPTQQFAISLNIWLPPNNIVFPAYNAMHWMWIKRPRTHGTLTDPKGPKLWFATKEAPLLSRKNERTHTQTHTHTHTHRWVFPFFHCKQTQGGSSKPSISSCESTCVFMMATWNGSSMQHPPKLCPLKWLWDFLKTNPPLAPTSSKGWLWSVFKHSIF